MVRASSISVSSSLFVSVLVLNLILPTTIAYESSMRIHRIAETSWRRAAQAHQKAIRRLLEPGLLPDKRQQAQPWTALDPIHPVYNFLIEYYGLKGAKGVKRLARWSPPLEELLLVGDDDKSTTHTAILLEGATDKDLGTVLHLKGAMPSENGILYSPSLYYKNRDETSTSSNHQAAAAAAPFLWNRAILQQTLRQEPVLHCHNLHEWAMQYQPEGAPEPPSAKYQRHLRLRVSRQIINETVERKGVKCTHVDALKYFAPAAGELNQHGVNLPRSRQLELEQPACVHAQMDLLKYVLRLQPFCNAKLIVKVLQVALNARRLDVAASPYDASDFGVEPICIETPEGRSLYRKLQAKQMMEAEPVRKELLRAHEVFLETAFGRDILGFEDASTLLENHRQSSSVP